MRDEVADREASDEIPRSKLDRIFHFDKSIRFVVLLSSDGRSLANVGRSGITSLEPSDETRTIFTRAAIVKEMSVSENKHHGPVRTVIIIREKVALICFMVLEKILLISAEPSFPLGKVEKLGRLIDELNIA